MTKGAVRDAGVTGSPAVVSIGRPPWWLAVLSLLVAGLITADLLADGRMLRLDLRVSEIVSDWGLRDSAAYPLVWVVTQLGGRVTILVVLAGLVGYLAWRRGVWLPLLRLVLAVGVLTAGVYAMKHGTGRTAPAFPGSYFFHDDGASFPSGHVANAVVMWGVARWQAVRYGLPATVQRTFWWLSIVGPVATGVSMVSLDYHWVTDAVVGAAVGIVLLGVVHALDAFVLSRWVREPARRSAA
ncbi:phosphatase PAP2 family protein [Blastococcus sp. LR1]|uniref:phosphatase PAP2 family protein n=1 Tax=Blastococcus sp. LR1 TaxID=2877000 RepID=UPI001CCB6FB5|nr:phosphatase PAP2 family protein [Blastococcus sp. LR1]MCA0146649.1 phosphatase PAP2 family protein [Blastococcus sp. LR1]